MDENFGLYSSIGTFITGLQGVIDLYDSEDHGVTVTKTTYPLDAGGTNTDNAINEPDTITLRGTVSDLLPALDNVNAIPGSGRASEAWQRIVDIAKRREPVTVTTDLRIYQNMLITSARTRKDARSGGSLVFTISLEETLIGETELTTLPPSVVDADSPAINNTSTINGGNKQSLVPNAEKTAAVTSIINQGG